ncbi:MAG TPA: DUF924 family protein [Gammaproteobacteria bacterium]
MDPAATEILEFWFGRAPPSPAALEQRMAFWFGAAPPDERRRRDEAIRARFGHLIEPAASGALAAWAQVPRGRLALIILLDQFPRNAFRGTARAFAYDTAALRLTLDGLEAKADVRLEPIERIFFYLPLQHAESLAMQDLSVAAYRRLLAEAPPAARSVFEETLRYAEDHRAVVARFGRYPHRNRILGRISTPDELAYLETADSYGQ